MKCIRSGQIATGLVGLFRVVAGWFGPEKARFLLFLDAVALPLDVDRDGMMQESVQYGRCQHCVTKDFSPCAVRFVGGEDDRSFFIAFGNDLEEKMRCGFVHLPISDGSVPSSGVKSISTA